MELVKRLFTDAAGERTILLRGGTGFVYEILMVRYVVFLSAQPGDADRATIALSTRGVDQVNDATATARTVLADNPNIFATWSFLIEKPTDVGITDHNLTETIIFPKPYTVPYLAALWSESIANLVEMGLELYFERRKASQKEIADLVIEAGGRTRT